MKCNLKERCLHVVPKKSVLFEGLNKTLGKHLGKSKFMVIANVTQYDDQCNMIQVGRNIS